MRKADPRAGGALMAALIALEKLAAVNRLALHARARVDASGAAGRRISEASNKAIKGRVCLRPCQLV